MFVELGPERTEAECPRECVLFTFNLLMHMCFELVLEMHSLCICLGALLQGGRGRKTEVFTLSL